MIIWLTSLHPRSFIENLVFEALLHLSQNLLNDFVLNHFSDNKLHWIDSNVVRVVIKFYTVNEVYHQHPPSQRKCCCGTSDAHLSLKGSAVGGVLNTSCLLKLKYLVELTRDVVPSKQKSIISEINPLWNQNVRRSLLCLIVNFKFYLTEISLYPNRIHITLYV